MGSLSAKEILYLHKAKKDPTHPAHGPANQLYKKHKHKHDRHKHHPLKSQWHEGDHHMNKYLDHYIAELLGLGDMFLDPVIHATDHIRFPKFLRGKPLPRHGNVKIRKVKKPVKGKAI